MGKYDDMFNKYFNKEEFYGDHDKRDFALKSFNKMMGSLENVKISDDFINKYLQSLNIRELGENNEELLNEDGSVMLPIFEDVDEVIESLGMSFNKVKLKRKEDYFIINEVWQSEDDGVNEVYLLHQKYLLNIEIFDSKGIEIQEAIVKKIVNNNYIYDVNNDFLNALPIESQKEYYEVLLDGSVDAEMYEDSAMYRDKLSELNYMK
jgi:hypothetical protein